MKFQIYETDEGWSWRLIAANGREVAHAAGAFTTMNHCKTAITDMVWNLTHGEKAVIVNEAYVEIGEAI
jgi:uncharacterized protein YegP (UPF0339 family)